MKGEVDIFVLLDCKYFLHHYCLITTKIKLNPTCSSYKSTALIPKSILQNIAFSCYVECYPKIVFDCQITHEVDVIYKVGQQVSH